MKKFNLIWGSIILTAGLVMAGQTTGNFTVGFWGDSRANSNNAFEYLAGFMVNEQDQLIDVHWQNGDMTNNGNVGDWERSLGYPNVREALTKDYFYMCTSNHEAIDDDGTNWDNYMGDILPSNGENTYYYHVEWELPDSDRKLHLFALDLYWSGVNEQKDYFAPILEDIDPDDWIALLWHAPTYGGMTYKGDNGRAQDLLPMFSSAGADFVLNGHAHQYRRTHVLDDNGEVAENVSGAEHTSPENSEGVVHIINGRGGVFSTSSDGENWHGNIVAPQLDDSRGLVTLMEFDDNTVNIRTITIGPELTETSVVDAWSWTRGPATPEVVNISQRNINSSQKDFFTAVSQPSKGFVRLNTGAPAVVNIYNSMGKKVHDLRMGTRAIWNGNDKSGQKLPSGLYVLRAVMGKTVMEKSAMLINQ